MKRLTFVTCLYDLVKRGCPGHRTVDWMIANSLFVLGMDRELVIFTDPELKPVLRELRGANAKIIAVPFEKLLGEERAAAIQRGEFQRNAQAPRRVAPYVQLMWSKYAMLEAALAAITKTSHVGWIDLSISHIAKSAPEGVDVFADPPDRPRVHVLRCFNRRDVDHPDYFRNVQGHLAGGLIVGERERMRGLVTDVWKSADRAVSMGLAPLDEELLAHAIGQHIDDFSYSYGDYEDIVRNHDVPREGATHRKWIVEDARRRGLPDTMRDISAELRAMFPDLRSTRPTFSPRSCYLLQDDEEEAYFAKTGGAPEAALIAWAAQFITSDQVFVDVGAHVGTWTQHFAQRCKHVAAFEPQRSTYLRLHEGVRLAGLDNVTCYNRALGGHGELDLHVAPYGGWSTLRHRPELGTPIAVERVHCEQLDAFEFEKLGVIKIDAEGFEIDILRGATRNLKQHRPTLLLEAWDQEWFARERDELLDYVQSIGYGVVPISGWPQMLLVEPRRAVPPKAAPKIRPVDHPLLGLVMIVRDEAKRIVEVLNSYRPYIDGWTILDTGSTDGTQDLIRGELSGIPGTLHEEPFVDFATSRNRALELHGLSTIFTIMPNGDVLRGGDGLRSFLEARRTDRVGAYRVRISPGHYYHPLVMRAGAGWRYKWRTHECATGPNLGPQIPDVMVIRDRGNRTTSEWRLRWARDLDLLNRDLVDDPNDARCHFYLGQTHECLGQYAQALAFFERRATMGGYFDEVFEAKLRIGKMKAKLSRPWPEVQQAYLEAYEHDPRRAEPLYAIAEHWYDKGTHAVSRVFSVAAAELPKPPTDLFLDEEIYTWRAADRAAISSSYSGHMRDARYFGEVALRARPDDERLRSNRAFYAASAGELFGAVTRAIDFSPEPGWSASNPSISIDDEKLRCVMRTVNYKLANGHYTAPDNIIRTRNFLLDLDPAFRTSRIVEMVDKTGGVRTDFPVRGFEDCRLFQWRHAWRCTATVRDFTDHGRPEIALLMLNADGEVITAEPLRGPWSDLVQKNWMPIVDGDTLKFVYATYPTTIFDFDGVVHAPEGAALDNHGRLRGGSQGVRVDDGWIFIVHDVAFPGGGRIYLHRFVFFNQQFELTAMTAPFYFEKRGIEFAAGLVKFGDKLIASYGVDDAAARLGIFELAAVRRALHADFLI